VIIAQCTLGPHTANAYGERIISSVGGADKDCHTSGLLCHVDVAYALLMIVVTSELLPECHSLSSVIELFSLIPSKEPAAKQDSHCQLEAL